MTVSKIKRKPLKYKSDHPVQTIFLAISNNMALLVFNFRIQGFFFRLNLRNLRDLSVTLQQKKQKK